MQATIAKEDWLMRTTSWIERSKSTVTTAGKRTTRGTSSARQENGAGNTDTDGGMNMSVAGMNSVTGMTVIMIVTGTRS